jgi:hypothetical protein
MKIRVLLFLRGRQYIDGYRSDRPSLTGKTYKEYYNFYEKKEYFPILEE